MANALNFKEWYDKWYEEHRSKQAKGEPFPTLYEAMLEAYMLGARDGGKLWEESAKKFFPFLRDD